jgi:hypothetical protein
VDSGAGTGRRTAAGSLTEGEERLAMSSLHASRKLFLDDRGSVRGAMEV